MKQADKIAKARILEKMKLLRASNNSVNPSETKSEKDKRIERAKDDYKFMVEYYFPHYATSECAPFQVEFANMVVKNPLFKGFAQWGRGLAKSVTTDILIPFWLWLRGEQVYMVVIGNSEKKAIQLLADIRAEFEMNPRIIADFGAQKTQGSWEEGFFVTKSGFIGQALGTGQNVRGLRVKGQRPTLIIPDDIETKDTIKNEKRQDEIVTWIEQDLLPTMDGAIRRFLYSNNAAYPIMIGLKLQIRHPNWIVHEVKAYDPITYKPAWEAKYSDTYYQELEIEIGVLAALAEYNNEPHVEGKIFKKEEINWGKLPRLDTLQVIVGHWDVAYAGTATADYNAVRVWGLLGFNFWYITSFVKKTKMRAALEFMADYQRRLPKTVIIHWRFEAQFWNEEVERTIREVETDFRLKLNIVKVYVDKVKKYDRMLTLKPYYQNGRIWYNDQMKGHQDTQVGIAQLLGIEPGYSGHDDAPDGDEQAIKFLEQHIYVETKGNTTWGNVDDAFKHVY